MKAGVVSRNTPVLLLPSANSIVHLCSRVSSSNPDFTPSLPAHAERFCHGHCSHLLLSARVHSCPVAPQVDQLLLACTPICVPSASHPVYLGSRVQRKLERSTRNIRFVEVKVIRHLCSCPGRLFGLLEPAGLALESVSVGGSRYTPNQLAFALRQFPHAASIQPKWTRLLVLRSSRRSHAPLQQRDYALHFLLMTSLLTGIHKQ